MIFNRLKWPNQNLHSLEYLYPEYILHTDRKRVLWAHLLQEVQTEVAYLVVYIYSYPTLCTTLTRRPVQLVFITLTQTSCNITLRVVIFYPEVCISQHMANLHIVKCDPVALELMPIHQYWNSSSYLRPFAGTGVGVRWKWMVPSQSSGAKTYLCQPFPPQVVTKWLTPSGDQDTHAG